MVNGAIETGSPQMTTALKYLSRMTDQVFETQMRRAARKITARQQIFHRRAA
jgi:hypothetical protein